MVFFRPLIVSCVLACLWIQRVTVVPLSPWFICLHSVLWPAAFSPGTSRSFTVRSLHLFIPLPPSYWLATTVPAPFHLFPCLLGIIRHRLWIARNAIWFDGSSVVYTSLLASVKSSLQFVVRIQQATVLVIFSSSRGVLGFFIATINSLYGFCLPGEPGGHLNWLSLPVLSWSLSLVLSLFCLTFFVAW